MKCLEKLFKKAPAPVAVIPAPLPIVNPPAAPIPAPPVLALVTLSGIPRKGDIGIDVTKLQLRLNEVGNYNLVADGNFGGKTEAAVSDFQKKNGLAGSGVIGPITLSKLSMEVKATTSPVEPAQPPPAGWYPPSIKVSGTRNLEAALEKHIDDYLLKMYPAELKAAIANKDGNELVALANIAFAEWKIREKTNNNDGYYVELLQETIGGHSNEAWCMAEQQSAVAYAERKLGIKSRIVASESTVTVATDTPKDMKVAVEDSKRGDIWIWQHGKTWTGHTGTFLRWIKVKVLAYLSEGNTTAGKSGDQIVREGGGSYFTERSTGKIGDMTLIAVVRAFDEVKKSA